MPSIIINGDENDNTILGLTGYKNTINGNGGNDTIFGAEQNDKLNGNEGNDWIQGGAGNDVIKGNAGQDFLFGEEGNDTITELNTDIDNDFIGGGSGNDTIHAGGGADYVSGGADDDVIYMDDGNDTYKLDLIVGEIESGNDEIHGGNGDDNITVSYGNDIAYGDAGNDGIVAFAYDSQGNIAANVGDVVTAYGGANNDTISVNLFNNANTYNDYTLIADGGNGADTIISWYANSTITGGIGNDYVYIADGAFNYSHTVDLGDGKDTIGFENTVDLTLTTGTGNDIINITGASVWDDTSHCTVTDFTALADEIHADNYSFSQCVMNDNGTNTVLTFDNGFGTVYEFTLLNVTGYTVNDLVDFV